MRKTYLALALAFNFSAACLAGHGGDGQETTANPSQMATSGTEETAAAGAATASSSSAQLSSPATVPNATFRSVPDRPGTGADRPRLDRPSQFVPRSTASAEIYQQAYNADREIINKFIKNLGR